MRILLFGANGQLGHTLLGALPVLGTVIATTRSGQLDSGQACEVADFNQPGALPALIERLGPDVVVNAAAYTGVDRAEGDTAAAFRANAEAPGVIARACAARGARLLHYSTDYVFDGSARRPYRESDPTSPLGVYGASKLAGEDAIRSSGVDHLILRTAWVYAAHGANFLRTMLRLAAERDTLRVVGDQVGTPTSTTLIAGVTRQLLAAPSHPAGVFHLTATGMTSWHGFAEAIVAQAAERGLLSHRPSVEAIGTADYPTPARRPAYSCLDTDKLRAAGVTGIAPWQDDLSRVLAAIG